MSNFHTKLHTIEEIETELVDKYGSIPRGSLAAYEWMRKKMNLDSCALTYEERLQGNKTLSKVLGLSSGGGLAGRDIEAF